MNRTHTRGALAALLLILLAACSPREQEVRAAVQQPMLKSDKIVSADGVSLPLMSWMPSRPRAVIVALHGFNDYANAFALPAAYLNRQNIGVVAYDQRGFGAAPKTGIWAGEENLISDLRQVVMLVKKRYPSTPVYVMGESMGGAVAIAALARPDFPKVSGLILVAPAVWGDKTMNAFFRATLWLFAHTVPGETIQSTGDRLKILASDNIEMLRALGRDPLVIKKTRIDAIYGMMHLMDSAYRQADSLHTPVLLLYGAHDQIIPPQPVKNVLLRMKTPYVFGFYTEGYHMLLRDLKADVVRADVAAWIRNKDNPLPSGADRRWKERQLAEHKSVAHNPTPLGATVASQTILPAPRRIR